MEKVKNPNPGFFENYRSGQVLSTLIGNILIILMMVSIGVAFHHLGSRLIPGWNGVYLVGVSGILALESIYSRKRVKDLESKERMIFRISEWIAFAVAIKLLLYLIHDPSQLIKDLPLWQEDFFQYFFTGEYMLTIFVAIVVWWSSLAYSAEIEELYSRELDTDWDDLGKLQNALRDIRNRISSRIFGLGTLVVGLAVIARLDIANEFLNRNGLNNISIFPIINVLFYFVLALILLTQTQFALLRTRWLTQHLVVSSNLARNWIRYGIIFFVFLAIIVLFLPTDYSIGLLETLRYLFGYIFQALAFLLVLITLPITYCLSLFSMTSASESASPGQGISQMPITPSGQALPWWDFVRSLLFWLFFLGIIFFAIRYYLMQNTALLQAIKRFAFFRWFSEIWKSLVSWFRIANRQVSSIIAAGINNLRTQKNRLPSLSFKKMVNVSKMSPRQKIIFYYVNFVELGGEKGLERKPSQTPLKYQQSITNVIPEVDPEIKNFTETFLEARYSQHTIEEINSDQAGTLWEKIKMVLRSWKKEDGGK